MEYGMPRNFRAPRPREDNRKAGGTPKRRVKKKFGLRLTHHRYTWRERSITWSQWYTKETGRDAAFKHYMNQKQWFKQNEFMFEKVEKVER